MSRCSGNTATLQVDVWSWSVLAVAGTLGVGSMLQVLWPWDQSFPLLNERKMNNIHTSAPCAHQIQTSTGWTPWIVSTWLKIQLSWILSTFLFCCIGKAPGGQIHWFPLSIFLLIRRLPLSLKTFHIVSPPPDQNALNQLNTLTSWPESQDFECTPNTS